MRAKQVMSRLVHTVAADASVYDAAQVLLNVVGTAYEVAALALFLAIYVSA